MKKNVLVVDDDQDLMSLVTFLLESEDYQVMTAADGRQGLDVIERDMPDLILLDMKMPVMDGREFAREFHARYDAQAPIIVLTADGDARRRAEETGAVAWISKPFNVEQLLEVVRRCLQDRK